MPLDELPASERKCSNCACERSAILCPYCSRSEHQLGGALIDDRWTESMESSFHRAEKRIAELEDDDSWMERAAAAQENGVCPVCFASDEAGHTEGCAWGQDAKRISELDKARDAAEAELRDIEQYREETYTRAEQAEAENTRLRVVLEKAHSFMSEIPYKALEYDVQWSEMESIIAEAEEALARER